MQLVSQADPDLLIIVGEISHDFGFPEGFFLYDLFLKTFTQTHQQKPFLVVPGIYDFSQKNVHERDMSENFNINVFPQMITEHEEYKSVTSVISYGHTEIALMNNDVMKMPW
jgi:metallophosphoesterase superfamily enzyme